MSSSDIEGTDAGLMAAVGRLDARAFAVLVERHLSWALRFVERMVGGKADAEDLVQMAFLRVWQGAARWEPTAQFRTWFYRVLYNLCMDHFRSRGAASEPLDESIPDDQATADERLYAAQRSEHVRQALAALPERQRAAIVLCYYEERSQTDAATLLGVSEGALESLLSRGRAALKKSMRDNLH
ncbi:MAG: sigma-70 family RNA polymerase sigma factor [Burkholderiales bacterium]